MDRIKELVLEQMKKLQISKPQLAEAIGVTPMTIYNWFKGTDISLTKFLSILEVLDMDLEFTPIVKTQVNNSFRFDDNIPTGYEDYDEEVIGVQDIRLIKDGQVVDLDIEQMIQIEKILKNEFVG